MTTRLLVINVIIIGIKCKKNHNTIMEPAQDNNYHLHKINKNIHTIFSHKRQKFIAWNGFRATQISYTRSHNYRRYQFTFVNCLGSMMTSSNGNIFPRYWPFLREILRSGHRWIPITKTRDAELWSFFMFAWTNGWAHSRDADGLRRLIAHGDVTIMSGICFTDKFYLRSGHG